MPALSFQLLEILSTNWQVEKALVCYRSVLVWENEILSDKGLNLLLGKDI